MNIENRFKLGSRYYFSRLNNDDRKIYKKIYDEWNAGKSNALISTEGEGFFTKSGTEIHTIVKYIICENPHLFHLETSQFNYSRKEDRILIETKQIYSKDEYEEIYDKLVNVVSKIVKKINISDSDYKKAKFLHDFLASTITYNSNWSGEKEKREIHTIVGSLLNSSCVCDGYSRAYRLLCDQVHVSNIIALGQGRDELHAWNVVKINGKPYHVDVTWDSNLTNDTGIIKDFYFLKNDDAFKKTHSWDIDNLPICRDNYPISHTVIKNRNELENYLCKKIEMGDTKFIVVLDNSLPGQKKFCELVEKIIQRNSSIFNAYSNFSFYYNDEIDENIYVELIFN